MISVKLLTDHFAPQSVLMGKHKKTIEWLSAATLWKGELSFFQSLVDHYKPRFSTQEDKKKLDRFQNLITYYNGELVDCMIEKLRGNELLLAKIVHQRNLSKEAYFQEHEELVNELESFNNHFINFKKELYTFIEGVMD